MFKTCSIIPLPNTVIFPCCRLAKRGGKKEKKEEEEEKKERKGREGERERGGRDWVCFED